MLSELVRRGAVLALLFVVVLRVVVVGDAARPAARRSPARAPRGLELRTIKRLGGRVIALRLQVVIA